MANNDPVPNWDQVRLPAAYGGAGSATVGTGQNQNNWENGVNQTGAVQSPMELLRILAQGQQQRQQNFTNMRSPEVRRNMGGGLVDENTPTGIDWLKAHGSGEHSWDQANPKVESHAATPQEEAMLRASAPHQLVFGGGGRTMAGPYGMGYAGSAAPEMPFGDATPHTNMQRMGKGEQDVISKFLQQRFNQGVAGAPSGPSANSTAFLPMAKPVIEAGHDYAKSYRDSTRATSYTPKHWHPGMETPNPYAGLPQAPEAPTVYQDPAASMPQNGTWPHDSPLYQGAPHSNFSQGQSGRSYQGDPHSLSDSLKYMLGEFFARPGTVLSPYQKAHYPNAQ